MPTNVLVVGGGRVGRHVAEELGSEYSVTIVEKAAAKCEQVCAGVSRVIEGDGTDDAVFAEATAGDVAIVAALTNDTETNLTICEMAADSIPAATTILRVARDGEENYGYRSFVDHVVYPARAGARETSGLISDA